MLATGQTQNHETQSGENEVNTHENHDKNMQERGEQYMPVAERVGACGHLAHALLVCTASCTQQQHPREACAVQGLSNRASIIDSSRATLCVLQHCEYSEQASLTPVRQLCVCFDIANIQSEHH